MFEYTIKLAGIPFRVVTVCHHDDASYGVYSCKDNPEFTIEVDDDRIDRFMREKSMIGSPKISIEPLIVHGDIAKNIINYDVLLFHGAAIEIDGKAVIFTAPSGTGKTTHINLWKQVYGDRVTVINGDKPLLKFNDHGIYACGTPWQGKENYGCNMQAPLKAICLVSRGKTNSIRKIPMKEMLPKLLSQAYEPASSEGRIKRFELLNRMESLDFYILTCNMEPEAATVAYEGIMRCV